MSRPQSLIFLEECQLNLNETLLNTTNALSTGGAISVAGIILALTVTLICALFIAFIYRTQYQGVLYHQTHATAIVLISLVTTMVIMVISGNLVLSLGMVGALSIVRFRGAIKEPLDIVYLFWAVGVGIANGVAYFSVSIISSLFFGLVLFYLNKNSSTIESKLLVVNCSAESVGELLALINSLPFTNNLRSRSDDSGESELVFEVKVAANYDFPLEKINNSVGTTKSRLLNYSANN
jgi:uncharacterized membrane protein YhiD involved in acid resistance